jgi:hypothetical protein
MKIVIICQLAQKVIVKNVTFIPRTGDYIDLFYTPLPQVKQVILFPTEKSLNELNPDQSIITPLDYILIEAVVIVD